MAEICVVHLLWGPLGTDTIDRFVAAYLGHPAGRDHELLVVFNGFAGEQERAAARASLQGIATSELHLERPVQDLEAYRLALGSVSARRVVFLNSYSEVQAPGWLDLLVRHAEEPGVGLVGAAGSWESLLTPAPLPLKALRLRRFGPFPNPHVRTNAFTLDRSLALDLEWPRIRRKADAWALENGRRSLTAQVRRRGLGVLVVGRDGIGYPPERFREAGTWRTGEQENLLVTDNRTREFLAASSERRRTLATLAWGSTA